MAMMRLFPLSRHGRQAGFTLAELVMVAAILVATPSGAQVALGELASVGVVRGATLIKSEAGTAPALAYA